jgi:hypothetical protein
MKTFVFPKDENTIKIVAPLSLNKTLRLIDLAAGVISNSYYNSNVLVVSEHQSVLSAFMFQVSNKKIKEKIITMQTNNDNFIPIIYDTVIVLYAKSDSSIKCSEELIQSFSENRPTFILDIKPTKSIVDRFGIGTRTNGRV